MWEDQEVSYAILSDTLKIAIDDLHRFSTDSVLLADFARIKGKDRLLDLCSGCGIVALSAFRGKSPAPKLAVGVDIQQEAVALMQITKKNARVWDGLAGFVPMLLDLRTIAIDGVGHYGKNSFDLVTCNPPYQKSESGFVAEEGRGIQRHELFCSIAEICQAAKTALRYGGRFCLCQRPSRLTDVMIEMRKVGIEPKRLRFIQKKADTAPWLFLLEGKVGAESYLVVEPPLVMYDENHHLNAQVERLYAGGEKNG